MDQDQQQPQEQVSDQAQQQSGTSQQQYVNVNDYNQQQPGTTMQEQTNNQELQEQEQLINNQTQQQQYGTAQVQPTSDQYQAYNTAGGMGPVIRFEQDKQEFEEYIHSKDWINCCVIFFVIFTTLSILGSAMFLMAPEETQEVEQWGNVEEEQEASPEITVSEDDFPESSITYEPPNPVGVGVSIICNILYIVICCKVRTAVQDDNYQQLEEQRKFWLTVVLGCIVIQLIIGAIFGFLTEVIFAAVFFLLYAYCFYVCLENHEAKIQNYQNMKRRYTLVNSQRQI